MLHKLRSLDLWSCAQFLTVVAAIALVASPALAAPDPFGDFGTKLWDLGEALIKNAGRGAMLLGGGWAVLAWMGKLGHFSAAIGVFVGGMFLSNLPTLVNYMLPN